MAARRSESPPPKPRRPPATTPEARENELISAAVDLAERQIRDGTASSQLITHFLKLGSSRERLEQQRIKNENAVLEAKAASMTAAEEIKVLYGEALVAMRSYAGMEPAPDQDYED